MNTDYPQDVFSARREIIQTQFPWLGRKWTFGYGWDLLLLNMAIEVESDIRKGKYTEDEVRMGAIHEIGGCLVFITKDYAKLGMQPVPLLQASQRSAQVCEVCGEDGRRLIKFDWRYAACERHTLPDSYTLAEWLKQRDEVGRELMARLP